MKFTRRIGAIFILLLEACGPSEEHKAQRAEQKRIECLDRFCEGDVEPKRDLINEQALKLNGQWFIGPVRYFGSQRAGFYWPSKTPLHGPEGGGSFPEMGKPISDVAIEIFLRSNKIPDEPRGYKLIELAQRNDWIASRKALRPGLEAFEMKHVIGPRGHYIDHVTYYVATRLKGFDGLPPVATCSHTDSRNGGGTGFLWQPGIWVGTRMNQKHCADWPEIFTEITRVLQLLRKVQP
jgi:hypothetical protein